MIIQFGKWMLIQGRPTHISREKNQPDCSQYLWISNWMQNILKHHLLNVSTKASLQHQHAEAHCHNKTEVTMLSGRQAASGTTILASRWRWNRQKRQPLADRQTTCVRRQTRPPSLISSEEYDLATLGDLSPASVSINTLQNTTHYKTPLPSTPLARNDHNSQTTELS